MAPPLALDPSDGLASHHSRARDGVKRAFDVLVSATALVVLAPMLVLITIAIRIDSPGAALFRQERIGGRRQRGNRDFGPSPFRILKFRTMYADVESTLHEEHVRRYVNGDLHEGAEGARYKLTDDPRVTRVGRILRRTSLDELPQLLNVLRGDMSLVGPRPVPVYEVNEYRPEHYARFGAPAGLTGLWQVSGRCDVSFEEMVRLDEQYVQTRGLGLDLKILALTIPALLHRRGAA